MRRGGHEKLVNVCECVKCVRVVSEVDLVSLSNEKKYIQVFFVSALGL